MSQRDISQARNPDTRASLAAIRRAAAMARQTAIDTDTGIVIVRDGKPVLLLDTTEAITEIFVEGNPLHYFGNPMLMRGLVRMDVSGAKTLDELRDTPLRITIQTRWKALEQVVTVV